MYKREVPKLNKEKISSCQERMRLHLSRIRDNIRHLLDHEYTAPPAPMIVDLMNEKRSHNNLMIEITSTLNDVKFHDIKNCANAKLMLDKYEIVYGGDKNVVRAKAEI